MKETTKLTTGPKRQSIRRFLVYLDTEYRPIESPVSHLCKFRPIVSRVVAQQSTDWLAANAQFSPNGNREDHASVMYQIFKFNTLSLSQ